MPPPRSPLLTRTKWGWMKVETVRGRCCQSDCVPAAFPCLCAAKGRSGAGYESGRDAGRPGWTGPTIELSHTIETPEDTKATISSKSMVKPRKKDVL